MEREAHLGRIINLGSSSKGNAYYIEIYRKGYDKSFNLLIECGFPFSDLMTRLIGKGLSLNNVHAVLVTHEHLDHAKSVEKLVDRGKKVYAPKSVFDRFNLSEKVDNRFMITEFVNKGIADGIKVFGLPLDHENDDGSKTYNLAYVITVNDEFNILFVTDTKYIKWDLSGYQFDVIFIEANYERRVIYKALKSAIKKKDGSHIHYERVLRSHMGLHNTAKTLKTFDLSKTKLICLIHLTANTIVNPFTYKNYIKNAIKDMGYNRIPKIIVAKRNGDFA
jgi:glyoxylase-like metal-dependent hydrolase (beta-lactamase superfamily II)